MLTFDLREKLIPFSLLQITNAFRKMAPGDEMEILAGSRSFETAIFKDIMRILPREDYELICGENPQDAHPIKRMRLKKVTHNPTT